MHESALYSWRDDVQTHSHGLKYSIQLQTGIAVAAIAMNKTYTRIFYVYMQVFMCKCVCVKKRAGKFTAYILRFDIGQYMEKKRIMIFISLDSESFISSLLHLSPFFFLPVGGKF